MFLYGFPPGRHGQSISVTQLYHVTRNGLTAVEYEDLQTRQGNTLNQTAVYYIQEREIRKPYEAMEFNFVRGRGKKSLDERVQKRNCKQEVVSGTQVGWFFQLHSFRYIVENYFYARKSDHLWPRQHCAREIWKRNNQLLFWICLRKTWSEKSRDYCDVIIFEKLRHSKCFLSTRKQRQYFQILPLKIVFEKILVTV